MEGRWNLRGVDGTDLFTVAALHPLVVDEETCGLGVLCAIGSCELNVEV